MALKRPKGPAGTVIVLEHSSKILNDNPDNPLGDPHVRRHRSLDAITRASETGQRQKVVL